MKQILHQTHILVLSNEPPGVGVRHHDNHRLGFALPYQIVHHLYKSPAVAPGLLIAVDAVQQIEDRIGLPRAVAFRGQV